MMNRTVAPFITFTSLVTSLAFSTPVEAYDFSLDSYPLADGCLSSSTDPDCYSDQNAIRASGFSHYDGSGEPDLTGEIPTQLQDNFWQQFRDALINDSYKLHSIEKGWTPSPSNQPIADGIYVDSNFNLRKNFYTEFPDAPEDVYYVLMAHQFDFDGESDIWCPINNSDDCYQPFSNPYQIENQGVFGNTTFFSAVVADTAPSEIKQQVNATDWASQRIKEFDLSNPQHINTRFNFLVGGRGIQDGGNSFWDSVAYVWVDPNNLYRPAQNWNIENEDFFIADNHTIDPGNYPDVNWCINAFANVVSLFPESCTTAEGDPGERFVNFKEFYESYWQNGSDPDNSLQGQNNFFPFPFTGLGVTYDPYYQAQLEDAANNGTVLDFQEALLKMVGTSEFIYGLPEQDDIPIFVDGVLPLESLLPTVPEPSAILGLLAVSSIGALVDRKKG